MRFSRETYKLWQLWRERENAALSCANQAAIAASRKLKDYKRPKVFFYEIPPNGAWSVFYASRFRSRTTDCFWVVVDSATHKTKLVPGAAW